MLIELLKIALMFAIFPAQLAWGLIITGNGFRIFLGIGMIIAVYGGLITAVVRGIIWLIAGRKVAPARRQSRRRRAAL